jgi:hypothetical protein
MVASANSIPAGATTGAFAQVIGVSERVVAGRKADGRLPKLPGGAIDLHAVIRAGVAAMAQRQKEGIASDALSPEEAYNAGLRLAANVAARLAVAKALKLPLGEDPDGLAAAAVSEAMELFELAPVMGG